MTEIEFSLYHCFASFNKFQLTFYILSFIFILISKIEKTLKTFHEYINIFF